MRVSMARFGIEQSGQEDVPEPVEADAIQIIIGEVEFEAATEVLDPPLQLGSLQCSNGGRRSFETPT